MYSRSDYIIPYFGAENTDIPGFATTNTISRYTGEPISNQPFGGRVLGETKSGLVRDIHYPELDLDFRFRSVDDNTNRPRRSNAIGGNLGKEGKAKQREYEERRERGEGPPQGEQNIGGTIGTGGVPSWNEVSTEAESAHVIDNTYERLNPDLKRDLHPPSKDLRGDVKLGSGFDQEKGYDLRSDLVGGPNPATKISGAMGRYDFPHDATNQMYYAENTGNVKSSNHFYRRGCVNFV